MKLNRGGGDEGSLTNSGVKLGFTNLQADFLSASVFCNIEHPLISVTFNYRFTIFELQIYSKSSLPVPFSVTGVNALLLSRSLSSSSSRHDSCIKRHIHMKFGLYHAPLLRLCLNGPLASLSNSVHYWKSKDIVVESPFACCIICGGVRKGAKIIFDEIFIGNQFILFH